MKRLLLAGAAVMALSSASFAADLGYAPEPVPVDIWSGFFVGIQGGYAFKDVDITVDDGTPPAAEGSFDDDHFVGGIYYGRNWQLDNSFVIGIDSSISYLGLDEEDDLTGASIEANVLGLSRLKLGFAMNNTMLFVAGGLSTSWIEVSDGLEDDDSFAFGWNVGAGVEHKFDENWSARIEYAYFAIEEDDLYLSDADLDVETEIDGHIVRAGVAYHF